MSVRLTLQHPAEPIRRTVVRPVIPTRNNGRRANKPHHVLGGGYPQRTPLPAVRSGALEDPPEEELQLSVTRSIFFSLRSEQNRIAVEERDRALDVPLAESNHERAEEIIDNGGGACPRFHDLELLRFRLFLFGLGSPKSGNTIANMAQGLL